MEGRKCILLICIISFTISIYAQIEDELGPCDPLVPQVGTLQIFKSISKSNEIKQISHLRTAFFHFPTIFGH